MKYPSIADDLLAMKFVDQEMRTRALKDQGFWNPDIDRSSTIFMKKVVQKIGWPTTSAVGSYAGEAAWLLVQHADHDPGFQKECLDLMKAQPEDEVPRINIAYLEDRVRVNTGRAQLYGTQFDEIDGRFVPRLIENPEYVDSRRKEMGLGTLQDGIKEMCQKYKS